MIGVGSAVSVALHAIRKKWTAVEMTHGRLENKSR